MRLDYRGALKRVEQATGAWLIHGNESLLEQNLLNALRKHWQTHAIERQRFDMNAVSDWRDVFNALNSLSLFSERLAVEVHGNIKPDPAGLAQLQQFIQSPAENILVIVMPRHLNGATQKTKFYQSIEANRCGGKFNPTKRPDRLNILKDEANLLRSEIASGCMGTSVNPK